MPLPSQFVKELKFKNDTADVIASYISLKKRGNNLIGLCPFHNEKTPSFHVYPNSESFYCFGCGVGGDVITFVEKIENLSYIDSVHFLAQRVGMLVPENNAQEQSQIKERERTFSINREAAKFFHESLCGEKGISALEYLKSRGVSGSTIKHFGIGYAPGNRFALSHHLLQKNYQKQEIINANLGFPSRNGGIIDRFHSRIMFPIISLSGNVIAFGGRVTGSAGPKYLNTSDTIVFKKSQNLFALNFAKNKSQESLILTEGYMDTIALHQAGFTNVVATLGTAITANQAKLIGRYLKEVVICYDADEAGQKATARAISILREAGLVVKVVTIPTGKDPDEFVRTNGGLKFKQLLENSKNDVEYRLQCINNLFDKTTTDGKLSYLKESIKVLCTLSNNIEQEIYAGKLAEENKIEKATIMHQIKSWQKKAKKLHLGAQIKEVQSQISANRDKINPQKAKFLRCANAEEFLISYIIYHPNRAQDIYTKLPPQHFCTEFNRRVYTSLIQKIQEGQSITPGDFTQEFSKDEIGRITKFFVHDISAKDTIESENEYINTIISEKSRAEIENSPETAQVKDYFEMLKSTKTRRK